MSRGGAFAVKANDPTAQVHNPGALSKLAGTRILYNHVLMWEDLTFTRAETGLPQGQDYGTTPNATVTNEEELFPLGLMLIGTSDFGLDDWTFALGMFGPHSHGDKRFPVQGGQRYLLTAMESILFYPSLSVAYGDSDTFGVGVTLQYVLAPRVKLGLVVDGSPSGELHAYHSSNDVEAIIELKDNAGFTAIVGGWWRPSPALEVALSSRVLPVDLGLEGDYSLRNIPGQTQFSDAQLDVTNSSASLDLTLPPIVRAGARYRHLRDDGRELFDIELNVVYEAWSMLERYEVDLEGTINLFVGAESPDTIIEKRWSDTVSVRLGGTYALVDDINMTIDVSAGAYWESGAVSENYAHLDFLGFGRVGLGLGTSARFGGLKFSLAYSHVFQEDLEPTELSSKVYQERPLDPCPESCDGGAGWSGVPSNAGLFQSSYNLLAFGLQADF